MSAPVTEPFPSDGQVYPIGSADHEELAGGPIADAAHFPILLADRHFAGPVPGRALPRLAQPPARPTRPITRPRTAGGQPDLQGTYTTATITPVTRDPKLGDAQRADQGRRPTRSNRRRATRSQRADEPTPPEATVKDLKNADCGADGISGFNCGYNQGWKDPGTTLIDINGEKRASIITSPANGQFPARGRRRGRRPRPARRAAAARTDNPEGFSLGERCILSFGSSAGPPMLPLMYNNTYQIVQSKDEVAIDVEMVHDVRHIHLNAQHVPASMKLWMGDSIGHWEGDTLVVETTNMRPEQGLRGGSREPRR